MFATSGLFLWATSRWSRRGALVLALAIGLCGSVIRARASAASDQARELLKLSLQELANTEIEVTVASRSPQRLMETPAAVSVITQTDIRRSGATSIPEALRLVPGLFVAQIGSSQWAVGSRFANSRYSNKFLVLMDGRTLYSPLFGGTFWDVQDTLLEDIDRIEVVRGPGASVWGSNAIAGVINIVTKSARDTQGGLGQLGGGTHERLMQTLRFGGKLGENGAFRVWGQRNERDSFTTTTGATANDSWEMTRGGFRFDWGRGAKDSFTMIGNLYGAQENAQSLLPPLVPPFDAAQNETVSPRGQNALFRWKHCDGPLRDWALQVFFDHTSRNEFFVGEDRQTYDVDYINRTARTRGDELLWGVGYRVTADALQQALQLVAFEPDQQRNYLASAFVQQRWAFPRQHLQLWAGAKLEDNSYTHLEVEPTVRATWSPNDRRTVWGAVSRGVRIPSREETSLNLDVANLPSEPGRPGGLAVVALGNPDLAAEELVSYELGYRVRLSHQISADLAIYHEDYRKLIATQAGGLIIDPTHTPPLILPLNAENGASASISGVELGTTLAPSSRWKLYLAYTALFDHYQVPGFDAPTTIGPDISRSGRSPRNQLHFRSSYDLSSSLELDTLFYYADSLPTLNVPSYVRADLRLGWRPYPALRVDLVGQNLLEKGHTEFREELFAPLLNVTIPRSVYGKLTWLF